MTFAYNQKLKQISVSGIVELITLVIYDIPYSNPRHQVAKYLKSKGPKRTRKSAFARPLTSAQRAKLIADLKYAH